MLSPVLVDHGFETNTDGIETDRTNTLIQKMTHIKSDGNRQKRYDGHISLN